MIFRFSVLLSSLAYVAGLTKYIFLNDEPYMSIPIIDMNPAELKYYIFMISLNKYTGSSNV